MLKPYTIEEVAKELRSERETSRLSSSTGAYSDERDKEWRAENEERIIAERVEVLNAEQERALNEKEYLRQEHVANWRKNDVALRVSTDKAIQTVELMGQVIRAGQKNDNATLKELAIECAEAVEAAFAYHGLPKP